MPKLMAELKGDRRLLAAIQDVKDAFAGGREVDFALQAGGMVIMTRWKELAPHKENPLRGSPRSRGSTGNYMRSIHMEVEAGKAVMIGTDITKADEGEAAPYPVILEYGSKRQPPYPSARPAFDEKALEAIEVVRKAYTRIVRAKAKGTI
jgi:HK97 gp10 family phage protein